MPATRLVIALLLVLLNGFFVAAEFAIVKIRATRVEELVRSGSKSALAVQRIHSHLDTYLSATQLGVTLASLALGWIGEPAVAGVLSPLLGHLSAHAAAIIGSSIAFLAITYFHIVFGELAPKWLAIQRADTVALVIAYPLDIFHRILYPVIRFLGWSARLLVTAAGIQPASESDEAFSESELRIAISQSQEGGAITESAEEIVDRAFHFGRGRVRDVMTPRPDVAFLLRQATLRENLDVVARTKFARYPLCSGDLDNVLGRVHVRDLLPCAAAALPHELDAPIADAEAMIGQVLYVPETKPLDDMLDEFQKHRMEMAIVQDEYGLTAGVVTLEDILEELVGEIQQEFARTPSEVHAQPDGSYLVDSTITLSRLVREYGVGAEVEDVETVGGYLLSTLTGHAHVGYSAPLGDWEASVAEMAGPRIRRIRLVRSRPIAPTGRDGAREG